jgi:hypothetical protein
MHPLLLNTNISQSIINNNPIVYSYAWTPYYGWYNQGETYGSQNGLTYLFPIIRDQSGVWGPSRSELAAGRFPTTYAQGVTEASWPGVGSDKWTSPYDIDWNTGPLSTATGYFGFTFGNTGHIGLTSINEIVSMSRWIPQANRIYDNSRHYRAICSGLSGFNRGIGYELIYNVPSSSAWGNSSTEDPLRTPWLKRKFNFIRKELQNIMQVMGNTGFFLNGMESDDEYYIFWDFRNIGPSTTFGTAFMYPNNSATGNCWYASYTGICAAPDYLITQGITSFRSYLLTHGFTTNSNLSKFVDGLTADGSSDISNNIAVSGSRDQSIPSEYAAALTDWTAMHWTDYVEDFKRYNGLCADNSFIGNYGYYRNNIGIQGYTNSSLDNFFTGLLNQNSSDFVPYPEDIKRTSSINRKKTNYYAYNYLTTNHSPGYVQKEVSNNFDSIYTYGGIMNQLKVEGAGTKSIDRQKLFYGNSYSYGFSFGIYANYNWQIGPVIGLASGSPIWWLPANYLNSNALGQTFNASLCYEVFGLSAAQKFDPTGINGSRLGTVARCGDNKVPQWNSWHLNPVWGITAINANSNYGPANYIPTKGPYGLSGMSMGQVSRQLIGTGFTWTSVMLDSSGFPYPGNTLPAGTLYKHYWSHWYPMAFMALNYDVNWGRQVAVGNVYRAVKQREGTYPGISGSNWNGIQRPINVWIQDEKLYLEGNYNIVADNDLAQNLNLGGAYFEPTGLVQGFYVTGSTKTLVTQYVAEAGVMYYENIRHQYLNKAGRYTHWNPYTYSCVTSATGGQVMLENKGLPQLVDGLTMYGVCGAITMRLGTKLNTVIGDCNTRGNGMVYQTVYLAPGNDSERSYLMSGAQKVDGQYLWRITFANPATDPSPIIIRGSCSGITTAYNISGVTDYINNPNNKFGVWWTTGNYEVPIVDNPPIPEALRKGIVNLPENPKIMYNATRNPESRNAVPIGYQNPDIFCMMESPYGYWKQTEQWGSNNGLTYMWPSVNYTSPGRTGPSKTALNAGIFPVVGGSSPIDTAEWAGVGSESTPNAGDILGTTEPWLSATGYIGFTFGSTGFIPTSLVNRIVEDYSWIPNKYRVFYPSRIWRWVDQLGGVYGNGITGSEQFLATKYDASTGLTYFSRIWTPWIKRKINFARAELKAFYLRAASLGFTMAHWEGDDEYTSTAQWDFRSIGAGNTNAGDPEFYKVMLYPNFSSSGSTWYANFFGSSAAPDSLIAEGITSMETFLLTRGFTSNPSGFRYVRGLTAVGNLNVQGNVAAGGSPFQYLPQEYGAALQDWIAYMWTDCVNDFKQYNGISADNSLSGHYYYARTNIATKDYKQPSYTNFASDSYLTKNLTRSGNDYIPYPEPSLSPLDADINVTTYYGYNNFNLTLSSIYNSPMSKVGDIDNMNFYGVAAIDQQSTSYQLIDRNLDIKGNSYKLSNSGVTFGKGTIGWYEYSIGLFRRNNNSTGPLYNDTDARKWLPEFYLGSCAPAQIVICRACAETLGNCGFFKFDPTGAFGSSAANPLKVGFDRAPHYLGWHLNPVWGINVRTFNGGATIGPANYAPILQKQIISSTGLTYGCISRQLIGGSTSATTYTTTGILDNCGNPFPGNTLPAGTLYNQYWTHWYPMAFMALLGDVKTGRHMASVNVATAKLQMNDPVNYPGISGSNWNKIQKPINSWIAHPYWSNLEPSKPNSALLNFYFLPKGITFNYELSLATASAIGVTFVYGETSPMYYENMRHQYLNKTGRFSYWNPPQYTCTTSISTSYMSGVGAGNFPQYFPQSTTSNPIRTGGLTYFGVCGAMAMNLARPINTVLGELQTKGNGIVWETIYLAPVNMDERSYLISGAQKVDGDYLWRITFAHPATQSPIIIRGSQSGITTSYNINGVTDYVNNPNSKFGVWWTSDRYEVPIVENPPVSEAERLNVLNLPENPAFEYNPFTMTEANPRPKINAFAFNWPFDTGSDPTTLNNWAANVNLFDYVSPLAFFTQRTLNDDWKDGIG